MRKFVSSLSLSGPVTPPMHGFGCAYQMPVCQPFLRGYQMTVIAKYIPNLSRIHSRLVISCRPECYPILRQWHMSGNPCQLNRSMQHFVEVYWRGFEILRFFLGAGLGATPLGPDPLGYSPTGRFS